jgi:hypothetical protein
MKDTHKLIFDPSCPVCNSFKKKLAAKIKSDSLKFIPDEHIAEFQFHTGEFIFEGKEAIDELTKVFPEVLDFFWILPPNYRHKAIHKTYLGGKWLRKLFKKDCNCK